MEENQMSLERKVDVPEFRILKGSITKLVPQILRGTDKAGEVVDVPREIMTPKQILYGRVYGTNKRDRDLMGTEYISTACAVIGDPDLTGEVIVGLHSDPLVKELIHSLNSKSEPRDGSLPVDRDAYQEIRRDALVISRDAAENLRNNHYSEQGLRKRVLDYVAEGDAGLVQDHLEIVQERRGWSIEDWMGLWVSPNPGLRLWCFGGVYNFGSSGGYGLDSNLRLAGVEAPEAPNQFGSFGTYRDAPQQVSKQEPRRSRLDSIREFFRRDSR